MGLAKSIGMSICAALAVAGVSRQVYAAAFVTAEDTAAGRKSVDSLLMQQAPPFSFTYDGKPSSELLPQWNPQTQEQTLDGGRKQRTITWKDPQSGLSVRMVSAVYADYPAEEWTVYLRNDGTGDTKVIENLRGINASIGQAPASGSNQSHQTWSAGKNFPKSATGEQLELYRGWADTWKPLTPADAYEGKKRFAAGGHAPWIASDSQSGEILMMPGQGIDTPTDSPETGKTPAIAYLVPADGVYQVKGKITKVGDGGDGVDWAIHNFANAILTSGQLTSDKNSAEFDQVAFLRAGEHIGLGINSGDTTDGDLCRASFTVTNLNASAGGDVVVHTNKGSDATPSDYMPLELGLGADESFHLNSRGGRPSDYTTMPYFNVQTPSGGSLVAIGWPGQWDATFARKDGEIRLDAGQEELKVLLHPGEEIRTPLIAVVSYAGNDPQHGQNVWRRWMLDHNVPRVDGKLRGSFVAANSSHQTAEMINGNEANQIAYIKGYIREKIKLDYWWMDAGWYVNHNRNWVNTGTWKPDPVRFPNGLKAVTDFAHSQGIGQILWFEPERVTKPSELYDEHPDFLLSALQDYSNPSAGLFVLQPQGQTEPNVTFNPLDRPRFGGPIRWKPKQVTMHPGPKGEYSAVRFTVPSDGEYQIDAKYSAGDPSATTDVHVQHSSQSLLDELINVNGHPSKADYEGKVQAKKGDTIDFIVGRGNGHYESDTTNISATITGSDGVKHDLSAEFQQTTKPTGLWTYGMLPPSEKPSGSAFVAMEAGVMGGADAMDWKLLNLGNPTAREWITDRVDSIIKTQGIDLYRQDFNIAPLNYWRSADSENRHGITENLYVQGYLKYWDSLRERNPKIWIDSCASGGRRNDLETMRRAVPLTRSDCLFEPISQQGHTYGICQWIPHNGTGALIGKSAIAGDFVGKDNPYAFRSQEAPTLIVAADTMDTTVDYDTFRRMVAEYREGAPNYFGDYYPLIAYSLAPNQWIGWQFDLAEKGSGMLQIFRRDASTEESRTLKLHGLDRSATYQLTDVDHAGASKKMTGAQLMDEGYEVKITQKPGSAVIRYAKQG